MSHKEFGPKPKPERTIVQGSNTNNGRDIGANPPRRLTIPVEATVSKKPESPNGQAIEANPPRRLTTPVEATVSKKPESPNGRTIGANPPRRLTTPVEATVSKKPESPKGQAIEANPQETVKGVKDTTTGHHKPLVDHVAQPTRPDRASVELVGTEDLKQLTENMKPGKAEPLFDSLLPESVESKNTKVHLPKAAAIVPLAGPGVLDDLSYLAHNPGFLIGAAAAGTVGVMWPEITDTISSRYYNGTKTPRHARNPNIIEDAKNAASKIKEIAGTVKENVMHAQTPDALKNLTYPESRPWNRPLPSDKVRELEDRYRRAYVGSLTNNGVTAFTSIKAGGGLLAAGAVAAVVEAKGTTVPLVVPGTILTGSGAIDLFRALREWQQKYGEDLGSFKHNPALQRDKTIGGGAKLAVGLGMTTAGTVVDVPGATSAVLLGSGAAVLKQSIQQERTKGSLGRTQHRLSKDDGKRIRVAQIGISIQQQLNDLNPGSPETRRVAQARTPFVRPHAGGLSRAATLELRYAIRTGNFEKAEGILHDRREVVQTRARSYIDKGYSTTQRKPHFEINDKGKIVPTDWLFPKSS